MFHLFRTLFSLLFPCLAPDTAATDADPPAMHEWRKQWLSRDVPLITHLLMHV